MSVTFGCSYRSLALVSALGVALAVGTSACGGTSAPSVLQVHGVVDTDLSMTDMGGSAITYVEMIGKPKMQDAWYQEYLGQPCAGFGGQDDVSGAEILIKDAAGKVLGLGHVSSESTLVPSNTLDGSVIGVACEWTFTIPDVPVTSGIYAVSVRGSREAHFSAAALRKPLKLSFS